MKPGPGKGVPPQTRTVTIPKVDFHFVREKVALGALDVRFITSNDQVADGFTKPATRNMLDRLRYNINLVTVKIAGECKQGR